MATIDKIRLSGQTYDIIDATAIHSLDGYATTGYVQSATSALAESFEEVISAKTDESAFTAFTSATETALGNKTDESAFTAFTSSTETALGNKADTSALTAVNDTLTGHTADTTIHVTSSDKEAWNAKADISDIPSVSGYADAVAYDSGTTTMNFYHGGTGGTVVYSFDASPFIIDGMIDDVRIETVSGVTYLVIDFNTASGKEDIYIPLSDIFDPSNYYTKSEIDASLSGKVNVSDNQVEAYGVVSTTATTSDTSYSADSYTNGAFYAIAGSSDDAGKPTSSYDVTVIDSSGNVVFTESGSSKSYNLDNEYLTISITSHDYGDYYGGNVTLTAKGSYRFSNVEVISSGMFQGGKEIRYYTSSTKYPSYQSAEAIENNIYPALSNIESGKTDTSAFTAHTADTTIHVTSSDKETWNGKQNALTPGTGIQISGDVISVTGAPLTMDDHLDSGSTNPVMNSAITVAIDAKQATLVSGTNIKTVGSESILGSGNIKLMTASIGEGNDSTTLIFDFN